MSVLKLLIVVLFTTAILSLVWARFKFFTIRSSSSRVIGLVNDPAVVLQIVATYHFLIVSEPGDLAALVSMIFYVSGISLFWWSLKTARQLDFANSDREGEIITAGPYAIVRHPFYLSYILIWLGNYILSQSVYILIGLLVLAAVYLYSAVNEEKMILGGPNGQIYREYKSRVGMFIPKSRGKEQETHRN